MADIPLPMLFDHLHPRVALGGDRLLPGKSSAPSITVVIFCWRILLISESMDHHDSEIMDDRSID